jgi:hypothetical protein
MSEDQSTAPVVWNPAHAARDSITGLATPAERVPLEKISTHRWGHNAPQYLCIAWQQRVKRSDVRNCEQEQWCCEQEKWCAVSGERSVVEMTTVGASMGGWEN